MKLKYRVALLAFVTAIIPLSLSAESSPLPQSAQLQRALGAPAKATASRDAARAYANLPLSFEPAVTPGHYVARSGAYSVLVAASESSVAVTDAKTGSKQILRFSFENSNAAAQIEAIEPLPGVSNYYVGQDPNNWRLGVRNFAKLRTKDVYPGVDVVYYGDHRRLEFDFVVAPLADPRPIMLRLSGMDKLSINADGDLVAEVNGRPVSFAKPYAYQRVAGSKKPVSVEYALAGAGKAQLQIGDYDKNLELVIDPTLSYSTYLGGAQGGDTANGIVVDANNNAYITGQTCSSDFPGTGPYSFAGGCDAYVSKLNFNPATNVTTLVFTTLFGGNNGTNPASAVGNGIALDNGSSSPNIYAVGSTNFRNLAGANLTNSGIYNGGDHDAFIVILNPNGTLLRSTYLGGIGDDEGYAIAVDSQQNVVVAGQTSSFNFPVYNGFQPITEAYVAFVTKLDFGLHIASPILPGASAMSPRPSSETDTCNTGGLCPATPDANSTYYYFSAVFGGQLVPPPSTWPVDPVTKSISGSYLAGVAVPSGAITVGTPACTTQGVVQTYPAQVLFALGADGITSQGLNWGNCNSFTVNSSVPDLAGFNWQLLGPPVGAVFATTEAYGVALDTNGDVFVVGGSSTASLEPANYAWLPGMHYVGTGAWIIKLRGLDGGFVYATPLGKGATEDGGAGVSQNVNAARAVAVDSNGRAYVVGTADSTGGIYGMTSGSIYPTILGGWDAFILRMSPSGSGIDYSTYLGGSKNDQGLGVAVDAGGWAYITGSTGSPDIDVINPVVIDANGTTLSQIGGTQDAYVAKITPDGSALIMSAYLGGSGVDQGNSIALSPNASPSGTVDIYVAGTTTSQDFPIANALTGQTNAPGNGDAFVTKILGTSFPMITVSPTSVGFGNQAESFSSSPQYVTLTNSGQVPLTINSIPQPTGDFALSNGTCATPPFQLAAGAACKVGVVFTPTSAASRAGTLTISDDATNSPQSVGLTGNGVLVQDSVSPSTLTFGSTTLQATSAAQAVTVTNTDPTQSLIVSSSPVITGDFSVSSNTCTSLLLPGKSCAIGVTFTPTAAGSRLGTLVINGNGNSFPATVQMTGTGNGAGSTGGSGTTGTTTGFSLTGPSTWAVTKGTASNIPLTLTTPAGYSGNVILSCAPTTICSLAASSGSGSTGSSSGAGSTINVPVSGATTVPVTVTVTVGGNPVLIGDLMRPGRLLATLLPFGGIGLVLVGRRRRWLLLLGLVVCLALGMLGCGGGATSSGSSVPTVTVTATIPSGNVQCVVPLTVF